MPAHDQDELRKQAQRVLSRRISTDSSGGNEPPREPERPRARQSPPPPQRSEERGPSTIETAEPRVLDTASPPPRRDQEPLARTQRRRTSSSDDAPYARPSAYDIRAPQRGEIYSLLHSRASLRRALIVNEVLGKPKALRESTDPENFGSI